MFFKISYFRKIYNLIYFFPFIFLCFLFFSFFMLQTMTYSVQAAEVQYKSGGNMSKDTMPKVNLANIARAPYLKPIVRTEVVRGDAEHAATANDIVSLKYLIN